MRFLLPQVSFLFVPCGATQPTCVSVCLSVCVCGGMWVCVGQHVNDIMSEILRILLA